MDQHPNAKIDLYAADFMDIKSVNSVSQQIQVNHPNISLLYNVAGVLTDKKVLSTQGLESHFAVNCLAPFVLTQGLLKALSNGSCDTRYSGVVNFSSSAVFSAAEFSVQRLKAPSKIGGLFGSYANSKLAADICNSALAPSLLSKGVLIYSVDPGATKTTMTNGNTAMPYLARLLRPLLFKSAEKQARKLIGAVEESIDKKRTGLYIAGGKIKPAPKIVSDVGIQKEILDLLEALNTK